MQLKMVNKKIKQILSSLGSCELLCIILHDLNVDYLKMVNHANHGPSGFPLVVGVENVENTTKNLSKSQSSGDIALN